MPQIYDPTNGTGLRRRRKRKAEAAATTNANAPSNRANSNPSSVSPPPPKKTSLKKHSKYQPTKNVTTKDPLDFCESSPATSTSSPSRNISVPNNSKNKNQPKKVAQAKTPTKSTKAQPATISNQKLSRAPIVSSPTKNTSSLSSSSSSSSLKHAIAIDTRFLDTKDGQEEHKNFTNSINDFLHSSLNRGLIPSSISWTQLANEKDETVTNMITPAPKTKNVNINSMMSNLNVRCESLTKHNLDSTMYKIAAGTPVHSSDNEFSRDTNAEPVCIPTSLSTNETWNIFGDLGT